MKIKREPGTIKIIDLPMDKWACFGTGLPDVYALCRHCQEAHPELAAFCMFMTKKQYAKQPSDWPDCECEQGIHTIDFPVCELCGNTRLKQVLTPNEAAEYLDNNTNGWRLGSDTVCDVTTYRVTVAMVDKTKLVYERSVTVSVRERFVGNLEFLTAVLTAVAHTVYERAREPSSDIYDMFTGIKIKNKDGKWEEWEPK